MIAKGTSIHQTQGAPVQEEATRPQLVPKLPVVEALPTRRELELKTLSVERLEKLIRDIIAQVLDGADPYRWKLALLTGRFQNMAGEEITGKEVLLAFTEQTFRKKHPQSRKSIDDINKQSGDTLNDVYDAFLQREFNVPPMASKVFDFPIAVRLPASFNSESLRLNSPQALADIMIRVCDEAFHGDMFAMTPKLVSGISILLNRASVEGQLTEVQTSGDEILTALSFSRFAVDNLTGKSEGKILKMAGYTVDDSLLFARQEALKERVGQTRARIVRIPSLAGVIEQPDPVAAATVLRTVFERRFPGREREVTYKDLFAVQIVDEQGRDVSAPFVLARLAECLFRAENVGQECSIEQILRKPEYSLSSIIERFKDEVLNLAKREPLPSRFATFTEKQIEVFIEQEQLTSILGPLGVNPGVLTEALTLLTPRSFDGRDVAEFVQRYVGLRVGRGYFGAGNSSEVDLSSNAYIRALFAALRAHRAVDLSEGRLEPHVRLFVRTLRQQFEEHPDAVIAAIKREAELYSTPNQCEFGETARDFFEKLYRKAADHFQSVKEYPLPEDLLLTQPFPYQREGIRFLASRKAAILADDVGLGKTYQAVAAALKVNARRVLWVTTASSTHSVRKDICEHFKLTPHDVKVVAELDPKKRSRQIFGLNGERFIVTNYDTLVALKRRHPHEYAKLTKDTDVLVQDEAQLVDNPKAQRSQAVLAVPAKHKWLLSATPYQNKPENLWTLLNQIAPERFPSKRAFMDLYTHDTRGLILLHDVISEIMLRRTKEETVARFQDPNEISFDTQLRIQAPRVPTLRQVDPSRKGWVTLSSEQEETIAWMIRDFASWARHYNLTVAADGESLDLNTLSPIVKFYWLHVALYRPNLIKISGPNPVIEEVVSIAEKRLAAGENVVVWAWNKSVVDELVARLAPYGAKRFDGSLTPQQRESAREAFQENKDTRVLVANYQTGGVGQTFTAAHTAIIAQLPLVFPTLLQVEGRHNRVLGLNNLRHAKQFSDVVYVVPCFSPAFLSSIEDKELSDILMNGTLAEQTYERLKGARILYNLIMEGYGDPSQLRDELHRSLLKGMGLTNATNSSELGSGLSEGKAAALRAANSFLPLWDEASQDPQAADALLQVIDRLRPYPHLAEELARVFREHGKIERTDIELVLQTVLLENRFLREAIVATLPRELGMAYQRGSSLGKECSNDLHRYLLQLTGCSTIAPYQRLARMLAEMTDTPSARHMREQFAVGLLAISALDSAELFLVRYANLFADKPPDVCAQCIYRLGLLAQLDPQQFCHIQDSYPDLMALSNATLERLHSYLEDFAERGRGSIASLLQRAPEWDGSMEHIAALLIGWRTLDDDKVTTQFKEVFGAILDDEYRVWRYDDTVKGTGRKISFLEDNEPFWEAFATNCIVTRDVVVEDLRSVRAALRREYAVLKKDVMPHAFGVEGPLTSEAFHAISHISPEGLEGKAQKIHVQRIAVGKLIRGARLEDYERVAAESLKLGLGASEAFESKNALNAASRDLEGAEGWISLERFFGSDFNFGSEPPQEVIEAIQRKVRHYRSARQDRIADSFTALRQRIERLAAESGTPAAYRIEESDSPAVISKMGCLEKDLLNCFNPNGNPIFTQFVVSALGSKNMKMLLVRNGDGRTVACAMMKVRKDGNGNPVLFLERGLTSGRYDFRREMLELLVAKAENIFETSGIRPRVMGQVFGVVRDSDPEVFGTGAFGDDEYVEATFGLRKASSVRHHAREFVSEQEQAPDSRAPESSVQATPVFGIGTGNKRIEEYIAELKEAGINCVVDVRAVPRSGRFPHFNSETLKTHLNRSGIEYRWLGDTLGNPLDSSGRRTLDGFDRYRTDPLYKQGLATLVSLAKKPQTRIAITCAETREHECHRKFILEDVRKALSITEAP